MMTRSLMAMHVGKAAVLHPTAARYQDQKGGQLFFSYHHHNENDMK